MMKIYKKYSLNNVVLIAWVPNKIKLVSWADSSHYITERLSLLKDNAVQGLLLVFILLSLFLNIKLAFWVAMGIPISVAGALAVMGSDWVGYSLNDITTFGLIIALGILVDDAVVVGESVFEERSKIKDPIKNNTNVKMIVQSSSQVDHPRSNAHHSQTIRM